MRKAYKKPVAIEFFKWDGNPLTLNANLSPEDKDQYFDTTASVMYIKTLEGYQKCPIGNIVIRGVHGEYYSCDPEIFKETYDVPTDTMDTRGMNVSNTELIDNIKDIIKKANDCGRLDPELPHLLTTAFRLLNTNAPHAVDNFLNNLSMVEIEAKPQVVKDLTQAIKHPNKRSGSQNYRDCTLDGLRQLRKKINRSSRLWYQRYNILGNYLPKPQLNRDSVTDALENVKTHLEEQV